MTAISDQMPPKGAIAVIFVSMRRDEDEGGYQAAARHMVDLARHMPGFLGMDSARGHDGLGVTVSYWADEASALAWRANAEHVAVREMGRERWYASYRVMVCNVERAYGWNRSDA